jgi:hypothetical protein
MYVKNQISLIQQVFNQFTIFRHQNLTMPKFLHYLQPDASEFNSFYK